MRAYKVAALFAALAVCASFAAAQGPRTFVDETKRGAPLVPAGAQALPPQAPGAAPKAAAPKGAAGPPGAGPAPVGAGPAPGALAPLPVPTGPGGGVGPAPGGAMPPRGAPGALPPGVGPAPGGAPGGAGPAPAEPVCECPLPEDGGGFYGRGKELVAAGCACDNACEFVPTPSGKPRASCATLCKCPHDVKVQTFNVKRGPMVREYPIRNGKGRRLYATA